MDETLKAMNKGSMSRSPKSSEGQMIGPVRGRELVNPNIMQTAPEVNQNIDVRLEFEWSLLHHRLELVLVLSSGWM